MHVEALPTTVVVDASVGLKWVVDEPGSDTAGALVSARLVGTSRLFWAEAANALASKGRRGELGRAELEDAWRDLAQAPLDVVPLDAEGVRSALMLAADLGHPVYACCYLGVALARDSLVITADRRFQRLVGLPPSLAARVVHLDQIEI